MGKHEDTIEILTGVTREIFNLTETYLSRLRSYTSIYPELRSILGIHVSVYLDEDTQLGCAVGDEKKIILGLGPLIEEIKKHERA